MKTIRLRRILSLAVCLAIILSSNALAIGVDDSVELDIYSDEVAIEHDGHDHEAYGDDASIQPFRAYGICPNCRRNVNYMDAGTWKKEPDYTHVVSGKQCTVYSMWRYGAAFCGNCGTFTYDDPEYHFCEYQHSTCSIGIDSVCIYVK